MTDNELQKYLDQGLSQRKIAEITGLSRGAVAYWTKKLVQAGDTEPVCSPAVEELHAQVEHWKRMYDEREKECEEISKREDELAEKVTAYEYYLVNIRVEPAGIVKRYKEYLNSEL